MIARCLLAALALSASTAFAQSEAMRLEKRPMRDGSGIVISYLLLATNTTNQVQCLSPQA